MYYNVLLRIEGRWLWDEKFVIDFFFFLGKGGELVDRGDNIYGGKWVVNLSGGFIFKGYFLGVIGNFLRYK